jgi:hypothetical protein
MKSSNPQTAWQIYTERKARPKENRTAFIAALIMERCQPDAGYSGFPTGIQAPTAASFAAELVRLATAIHHLCEAACNYQLSPLQEKRLENLQTRFTRLADALGFEASTGGDPRGACAFLINPDDRQEGDGWGTGWAVYS